MCATLSTVMYNSDVRAAMMPSFTLLPWGNDKSVMSVYLPVLQPLGIRPNLLTCKRGLHVRGKGPSMWPLDSLSAM